MKCRILALALLLTLPAVASDFWSPYVELGTRTNGYRNGAGAMLWTPILQGECCLLYGQAAGGHWWDNWALGVGGGYRQIFGEVAFGVNGFLDAARTNHHFGYGQGGLGLEFFACNFDVYVNGYYPFENHHTFATDVESVVVPGSGTGLVVLSTDVISQERAYSGFDIAAGYCLPICGNALHVSAGYFYYSTSHTDRIAGPRLGAEYRIDNLAGSGTQLRIGGQYEYNRVFGNYGSAVVGIRIPLGSPGKAWCSCCPCDLLRRLGNPARRAEGMLIREVTFRRPPGGNGNGNGGNGDPCIAPDGEPVELFYISGDASGSGIGTIGDPFNWEQAEDNATPFDIIALLGEGGDIDATENFQMLEGQIMVGLPSEECPIVVTPCGPLEAPLTMVRPNVVYSGPNEDNVITVADGVQVFGFDIDGQDLIDHVIGGNDTTGVLICDIGGSNTLSGLLRFQRPANLQVLHSNLTASANNGIFIRDPSGVITIDNNTIADIRGGNTVGININDIRDATTLKITNNIIDGTVTAGSEMDIGIIVDTNTVPLLQFDIDNNTISDVTDNGIEITQKVTSNTVNSAEGFVRNNGITRAGAVGILLQQDTGNANHILTVELNSNTMDEVGEQAILVERVGNQNAQGTLNATLGNASGGLGNSDDNSSSGDPAYTIDNPAGGDLCLTMQGNDSDRMNTPDIDVIQSNGTLTVYRRDDLSTDNNSLDVDQTGTIGTTNTPCPTPSAIP